MSRHLYTAHGYERLRDPGVGGLDARLYHHRLAAYAWDLIDSIDSEKQIHHRVECGWLNIEGNLKATDPEPHGRITVERTTDRRQNPEAGHPDVNEVFMA